jgi:hypothetical protein
MKIVLVIYCSVVPTLCLFLGHALNSWQRRRMIDKK